MASSCTVLARHRRGMCSPDRAASRLGPCSLQLRLTRTTDGEAERPQSEAGAVGTVRVRSGSFVYCLCSTEHDAGRFMPCSLAKCHLDKNCCSDEASQQCIDKAID